MSINRSWILGNKDPGLAILELGISCPNSLDILSDCDNAFNIVLVLDGIIGFNSNALILNNSADRYKHVAAGLLEFLFSFTNFQGCFNSKYLLINLIS